MFPENDWRYYLMHSDDKDMKYGLPRKKKYPMPDREHVRSAIKFFNYVSPSDEKELARNIIARIKEYRIVGINVGKENRFRKYYKPRPLIHSGIQGMKWGVKNGPPYPLSKEKNLEIRKSRVHTQKELELHRWYTSKNSKRFFNDPPFEKPEELERKSKKIRSYKESIEDDLIKVNPSRIGGAFNCRNCATAFELRRRGYDVEARKRDDGSNAGGAEKYFKDGKFTRLKNSFDDDDFFKTKAPEYPKRLPLESNKHYWKRVDKISGPYFKKLGECREEAFNNLCSELSKQGYGARGIMVVGWQVDDYDMTKKTSLFHAINYEVRDEVMFYDSQGANRHGVSQAYGFAKDYADPRDYSYMRTDNLELSDQVGRAVVSRRRP